MFGLIDCNNFFASCERAFNPSLNGKAVVVLSNNDGCVIARSNEAKSLGIKMGEPAFKIKHLVDNNQVYVFSSNYVLYGDMSKRVMQTIAMLAPQIEIYSIDEAFIHLHGMELINLPGFGKKLVDTTIKNTGIPVCLGIAPTKTLAKLANRFAKKHPAYKGVCIIDTDEKRIKALKLIEVGDVWGIGRRSSKKLNALGVITAYDFTQQTKAFARKHLTIVGERIWDELHGNPRLEIDELPSDKQQICTSRSFGEMIKDRDNLSEAVANFTARCAYKLRLQDSCAGGLIVFMHTNRFREDLAQTYESRYIPLPTPTNNTAELIEYALLGVNALFSDKYLYKKAGVIVTNIIPDKNIQMDMFDTKDRKKQKALMETMDLLNQKHGQDKVRSAAQGFSKKWKLKNEHLSPSYTTRLDDVIEIKA